MRLLGKLRIRQLSSVYVFALVFSLSAFAATKTQPTSSKTAHVSAHGKHHGKHITKTARSHGQQKIDPQRAHDIQEALVRNHYLSGEPTGTWDATSQKAMEKFQADNGWQSKSVPDSRALIKLGLGPDHEHLLNPGSAMTMTTSAPTVRPVSHSLQAPSNEIPASESSSQN
jgi:hypothetical protein